MSEPNPSKGTADLPIIQKWLQAVITDPQGIAAGIRSSEARQWFDVSESEVETVITPSRKRTALQRLEVYGNAYFARLAECLRSIYPTFAEVVGDETFEQFALQYLQRFPSRSYTLNDLGENFVSFLQETRPETGTEPGFEDFLIDLAHLEWSIDRVFDGPGFEGQKCVEPQSLQGLSPEVFWYARFDLVPCLHLLTFQFPVNGFLTAVRRDPATPLPFPEPSYLALTRRDFVVRRVPLAPFQWYVLRELKTGTTVGEAIEAALPHAEDDEDPAEMLAAAFQKFAAEQFFLTIFA